MEMADIRGPQLLIDKTKCIANIDRIYNKAHKNNLLFRPHFKTHQSVAIGRWFREYGVDRITVSSIKMAYYFAADGWKDILVGIAYNPREYDLYENLSDKCNLQATICCPEAASILSRQCRFPMEVMLKIDTGYNRTGIRWDDTSGLKVTIDHLLKNTNIKIKGLMTHDGSTYGLNNRELIIEHYMTSVKRINICRDNSGLDDAMISVGDTPSASLATEFKGVDEIRPGNFVFYDLMQYINSSCRFEDIAIALIAPIIDIRPASGTLVVHGGSVHLSKENIKIGNQQVYGMLASTDNKGWHKPLNEVYLSSLSQEHGIVKCFDNSLLSCSKPGDLIAIIPVHSCLTADCMGSYMLTSGEYIDHMRGISQDSVFSL